MASPNQSTPVESGPRYWRRVLRPLAWWLLLVLVLFVMRAHQRLSEQTRLNFTVSMPGQSFFFEPVVTLDDRPFISSQKVSVGMHKFLISHPKAESFATNLFVWYGAHDLGAIQLKRATGTLSLAIDPPAAFVSIVGPEWSVTLTNSSGINTRVPTDPYAIETHYAHWQQSDNLTVMPGTTTSWRITPRLGAVQLTCNQAGASFTLFDRNGVQIESGLTPALIPDLPEGSYKLATEHHQHRQDQIVAVTAGMTNQLAVEYVYGQALVDSVPSGASVFDGNGGYLGTTPLTMTELPVATAQFKLQLNGYEDVVLAVPVTANQTAEVHTNLVSYSYVNAMDTARKNLAAGDFNQAATAVKEVLAAKPDDADGLALQRQIIGLWDIQTAKSKGGQGDFISGIRFLNRALEKLPDNAEARQLLADFQQRAPAQAEQQWQERLNRPTLVFAEVNRKFEHYDLFEDRHLVVRKSVQDVLEGIVNALRAQPSLTITEHSAPYTNVYEIVAMQDVTSVAPQGLRRFIIVYGQTSDEETTILYKVMEYKGEAAVKFSIGNLINHPVSENYIPLTPSLVPNMSDKEKAQVQEGVSSVTAMIQAAAQ